MFGKNEIYSPFPKGDGSLYVHSIWYTLQGEGPDAGRPAVFIRLSKCNLRCYFCDTDFEKGEWMSRSTILERVKEADKENKAQLVVITGGEPLLQNILPVTLMLNQFGMEVSVETAGTVICSDLKEAFSPFRAKGGNLIVCSPKTPKINDTIAEIAGAFKYIVSVSSQFDDWGLPMASTQSKTGRPASLFRPPPWGRKRIWLQPMDEGNEALNKGNAEAAARLCMQHGYRLSMQLHKMVGVD